MELEHKLPCSQEPATGLCPQPDVSSPQLLTLFPIYAEVFQVASSL